MAGPIVFEPEYVEALRTLFEESIVFNRVLGLRIDAIRPGSVDGSLAMKPELIGHPIHQRLHGGVISASLDAMAGLAIIAAIGARHMDETPAQRMHRFSRLGTIDLFVAGAGTVNINHPIPVDRPAGTDVTATATRGNDIGALAH